MDQKRIHLRQGFPFAYGDIIRADNGDPVYLVERGPDNHYIMHGDSRGKTYPQIARGAIVLAHGKPLYMAMDGNGKKTLVWGTEESSWYDDINTWRIREGTLLFVATIKIEKQNPARYEHFVVNGGIEGKRYNDSIWYVTAAAGKPLYTVGNGCLVWGTQEIARQEEISHLQVADEKPLYVEKKNGQQCAILNKRVMSKAYDEIKELAYHEGAYCLLGKRGDDWFLASGKHEKKITGYNHVSNPSLHNGKPLFVGSVPDDQGDYEQCVVYAGKKEAAYPRISSTFRVRMVDDKPLYITHRGINTPEAVVHGKKQYPEFPHICDLTAAKGKPLYLAWQRGEKSPTHIMHGEAVITASEYDRIIHFHLLNKSTLFFYGLRNGKAYEVTVGLE